MINQEYLPCNRQIHIKISDEELKLIRESMEQLGFKNMSAYIRKMAIDHRLSKDYRRQYKNSDAA